MSTSKGETMSRVKEKKRWLSGRPAACELCSVPLAKGATFIDGRTISGYWGLLCPSCHESHGVGLGMGKGQRYSGLEMLQESNPVDDKKNSQIENEILEEMVRSVFGESL